MTEESLYPNATPTAEWGLVGAATHHEAVDDDAGTSDYIIAHGDGGDNVTDIFGFADTIDDVDEITAIEVNCYYVAADADESPSASEVTVDINLGGWQGTKNLNKPHLIGWVALTWAGLSGSQADMDGFQVKFYCPGWAVGKYLPDTMSIYSVRVDITYTSTGPSGWSHKISGIANVNIAKINGILIANIAKVNGV